MRLLSFVIALSIVVMFTSGCARTGEQGRVALNPPEVSPLEPGERFTVVEIRPVAELQARTVIVKRAKDDYLFQVTADSGKQLSEGMVVEIVQVRYPFANTATPAADATKYYTIK